jgi:hypothetical protein
MLVLWHTVERLINNPLADGINPEIRILNTGAKLTWGGGEGGETPSLYIVGYTNTISSDKL